MKIYETEGNKKLERQADRILGKDASRVGRITKEEIKVKKENRKIDDTKKYLKTLSSNDLINLLLKEREKTKRQRTTIFSLNKNLRLSDRKRKRLIQDVKTLESHVDRINVKNHVDH